MCLRKFENFPVRGKISVVDSGLKGELQGKAMQEISEQWTMYCAKSEQGCAVVLLVHPNGMHTKI